MEETEATKGRGGEAEDTGVKGTEEVTARRAEKKAEKPEEKSREAQRRGEDRMQKDTYVTQLPPPPPPPPPRRKENRCRQTTKQERQTRG